MTTTDEFRAIVRACVKNLDRDTSGIHNAAACVEPIREALAARGLGPGCHVGVPGTVREPLTPDATMEWYAGQVLDIVDRNGWFAMNSIINALDRFVPETP